MGYPARRRVTPQQYRRRRVVAIVLAAILVILVVSVGRWLAGAVGGDGGQAVAGADPSTTVATETVAQTIVPPTTQMTVAPTTVPDAAGPPTAQNPARIYVAGDSDAGTFGPYLETLLDGTALVQTTLDYKVSSGLARPDFYDWPARFREQVPVVNPDIVIVTFGGNDAQPIEGKAVDSDDWRAIYGERVGEVMDYLSTDGRTLIWVGIPNDDNPDVTARMQVQDEVVRSEAGKRPDVVFIDTWNIFSGRNGGFAEFVVDPRDGQGKDVRAGDGFHLNTTGAEILALHIATAIQDALRARGAAI